jgi:hypothetical protein
MRKIPRRGRRTENGEWIRRMHPPHINVRILTNIAIIATLRKLYRNYIQSRSRRNTIRKKRKTTF